MKDDGWILHIRSWTHAEACFVSYFQLRSLEINIMLLSYFLVLKEKKQKSSIFLQSYVISFIYVFSLFKKKAFVFCLTCLIFSAVCQNLTVNFWFYRLFSTLEKNSNYFKYRVCGFFLILVFKTFYSKSKPSKFGNTLYFLMSYN